MKRYLISMGVLLAGMFAVLAVLATLPSSRVSKATFERITPGMPIEEVQMVVGMPPTDEFEMTNGERTWWLASWQNADGSGIRVNVEKGRGVVEMTWTDSTETTGAKLRRWARWLW